MHEYTKNEQDYTTQWIPLGLSEAQVSSIYAIFDEMIEGRDNLFLSMIRECIEKDLLVVGKGETE